MGEAGGLLSAEGLEGGEVAVGDAGEQGVEMQAVDRVDAAIIEFCILCNLDHPDEPEHQAMAFRPSDDGAPEPGMGSGAWVHAGSKGILDEVVGEMSAEMDRWPDGFSGLPDGCCSLEGVSSVWACST